MSDPKGAANKGQTPPSNDPEQTLIRGRSEFGGGKGDAAKAPNRADRLMGRFRSGQSGTQTPAGSSPAPQPTHAAGHSPQSAPGRAAETALGRAAGSTPQRSTPSAPAGRPAAAQPGQQQFARPTGAPRPGAPAAAGRPAAPGSAASAGRPASAASTPSAGRPGSASSAGRPGSASSAGGPASATSANRPGTPAGQAATADKKESGGAKAKAAALGAGAGALAAKLKDRVKSATSLDSERQSAGPTVPNPKHSGHESAGKSQDHRLGAPRRTRKARLRLSQVDPWSVMKTAFLFSVAAGIVLWVATGTVWAVIGSSGLFETLNKVIGDIIQSPGDTTPFRVQDFINTEKVMGTAALIGVIDVVIFTALATLGAFLYNLASAMIGGLEVTLAED